MSDNAKEIVASRYLMPGEKGWRDVCRRVARYVASGLTIYEAPLEEILDFEHHLFLALLNRDFLFNSPTLFNAGSGVDPELLYTDSPTLETYRFVLEQGNEHNMLSACFVIPVENSIAGIYQALKEAALITKFGGGVGYDFSKLSNKGRPLDSGVGVASGPLSFIRLFDASAQAVMQGGRRRAAQMGILRVDHPDIVEFIESKTSNNTLSFFNISVMVTDEFMKAVRDGEEFQLRDPVTGEPVGVVDAREVWKLIIHSAWKCGDPGVVFFSNVNRDRYMQGRYIEATNPCGELPLYPYLSCNLGHVNLSHTITEEGKFNLRFLCYLIRLGTRALNLIIDVAHYPVPDIAEATRAYRPIGLGVMGFAHFLFKLGIRYGSPESQKIARFLSKVLTKTAIHESLALAKRYGPYPAFVEGDRSILEDNGTLRYFMSHSKELERDVHQYGLRNANWTTCAPTGTVSLIADTSSGIEPVFALQHDRVYVDSNGSKRTLTFQDPVYAAYRERYGDDHPCFVDAVSIAPEEHVLIQAAWQAYISSGVSKTINLSASATEEDVRRVYELAYELGCKGVTVFRDGCKGEQVLYRRRDGARRLEEGVNQSDREGAKDSGGGLRSGGLPSSPIRPMQRPITTYGVTREFDVACGTLYVTLNFYEGKPIETFLTTGKSGVCRANVEALSRMVSLSLRCGVERAEIVKQLKGIRCPYCLSKKGEYTSCSDALAKFLESCKPVYSLEVGEEVARSLYQEMGKKMKEEAVDVCPECHSPLVHAEGCISCPRCGFSRCS